MRKPREMFEQARGILGKNRQLSMACQSDEQPRCPPAGDIGEYELAAGASFERAYHHAKVSGFTRMQAYTLDRHRRHLSRGRSH